jgi:alpha-tubulin suppressor-like RCC1 family protein
MNVHPMPTPVTNLLSGTPIIAAGGQHACAAINSGVYCWGRNISGELGHAPAVAPSPQMVGGGVTITSLALGQRHMCFNALSTSGSYQVTCYGASDKGQVGVADSANHPEGVMVSGVNAQEYLKLSAGGDSTCAGVLAVTIGYGGELHCWGDNGHGQLGGGSSMPFSAASLPVCGASGCNNLTDFSVGYDHTCAALLDGVHCWGNGLNETLGFASGDLSAPGRSALTPSGAHVTAGYDHSCASYSDMTTNKWLLRCWGNNAQGQLGAPTTISNAGPMPPSWAD